MRNKKNYYKHESVFIDQDVSIGKGTKIWHFTHIQSNTTIGKSCTLGQNVNISNNVKIGNNVKIQNNVSVYEGVEIEDYVFCGPSMVFTNINFPRAEFPQNSSEKYQKTLVKRSASIGANATILCGITIGKYSLIGAGSVILEDVFDYALVVGNPGKIIGWVNEKGDRLIFQDDGKSTCNRFKYDGIKVHLVDDN
jgi:UDP-2-acetamido-3-amino-2,3-dideoxy-glucuronate N-acetyltransferase